MDLNHTIVPSLDKDASATFFARIFGLSYDGPTGHFVPVAALVFYCGLLDEGF